MPLGLTPENVNQARPMSRGGLDAFHGATTACEGAGRRWAWLPRSAGPVGTVIVTPQIVAPQQYSVVVADGVRTVTSVVSPDLQNAGTPAAMRR